MKRVLTFVALAALPGAVLAAADNAPLSGTKQELQQLQAERNKGEPPTAADSLKTSVPTLQVPVESATIQRKLSREKQERERRQNKDTRNNWLVDGMAKLEKEADGKTRPTDGMPVTDQAGADAEKPDPSDPAYLLKLYDEQKKADDTKSAGKAQRPAQNNAFAPFLQDWMAASPVKDQLLGDLARQSGGETAAGGATATSGPVGSSVPGGSTQRDSAAQPELQAKPNPYLPDTAAVISAQPGGSLPLLTPSGGLPPAVQGPGASQPAGPLFQPAPGPAPGERQPPPAPLADDKKYFPQLKRF